MAQNLLIFGDFWCPSEAREKNENINKINSKFSQLSKSLLIFKNGHTNQKLHTVCHIYIETGEALDIFA
jgi:hypothetical protein